MKNLEFRQAYLCEECSDPHLKKELKTLTYLFSGEGEKTSILCDSCGAKEITKILNLKHLAYLSWNKL